MIVVRSRMNGGETAFGAFDLDHPYMTNIIFIVKDMSQVSLHFLAFTNEFKEPRTVAGMKMKDVVQSTPWDRKFI